MKKSTPSSSSAMFQYFQEISINQGNEENVIISQVIGQSIKSNVDGQECETETKE